MSAIARARDFLSQKDNFTVAPHAGDRLCSYCAGARESLSRRRFYFTFSIFASPGILECLLLELTAAPRITRVACSSASILMLINLIKDENLVQ